MHYCPDDPVKKCRDESDPCACKIDSDCHKDETGKIDPKKECELRCYGGQCVPKDPKWKWCPGTKQCVPADQDCFVFCERLNNDGFYGPCDFTATGNKNARACSQCEFLNVDAHMERNPAFSPLFPGAPLVNRYISGSLPWWCPVFTVYHPRLVIFILAWCPRPPDGSKWGIVEFRLRIHGGIGEGACLYPSNPNPHWWQDVLNEQVCRIKNAIGFTSAELIPAMESLCETGDAFNPFTCNCGDFFLSALDKFHLNQSDLGGEKCKYVDSDCGIYAFEFKGEGCKGVRSTLSTGLMSLEVSCPAASTCLQSCASCAACPLDSLTCNTGFCLDSYPKEARERLITAIEAQDTTRVMEVLSGMFNLTSEQSQRCSTDFTSSGIRLGYGFKAPAMPSGTMPQEGCFGQLSPGEQEYWRKEYQKRKNCGTWIKVGGE